jgi:hypothetical protein
MGAVMTVEIFLKKDGKTLKWEELSEKEKEKYYVCLCDNAMKQLGCERKK